MRLRNIGFYFITFLSFIFVAAAENPVIFETSVNETAIEEPVVNYVDCGTRSYCNCEGNNHLYCSAYSWYGNSNNNKNLKNANIEILTPTFIPENIRINNYDFGILKNNETLPSIAKSIKFLSLASNQIKEIEDGTFDKFVQLKSLDLGDNEFKNLTDKILTEKLGSTLESLELSFSHYLVLTSVEFKYLTNLKSFSIAYNYNVGEIFANSSWIFPKSLSNLTTLTIASCNILNIPENMFSNLPNLSKLLLYGNPLKSYPKMLNSISTLRHLDLSHSSISALNQSVLGSNQHLNDLVLHDTEITSIQDCAFCEFSNLTTLHLYRNHKLSFIHENAFGYAKTEKVLKIESFSIEFCNLTTIPEKLLNWHNLKEIGIRGNPFNCNCSLAWLIDDIMNPTHTMNLKKISYGYSDAPLICKSPQVYKNQLFAILTPNYCTDKKYHHSVNPSEYAFVYGFIIFASLIFAVAAAVYYFLRIR